MVTVVGVGTTTVPVVHERYGITPDSSSNSAHDRPSDFCLNVVGNRCYGYGSVRYVPGLLTRRVEW